MVRFYAASFAKLVSSLERAESMLLLSVSRADVAPELPKLLEGELPFVFEHIQKLPVSPVIAAQAKRVEEAWRECDIPDHSERRVLHARLIDFKINLLNDLKQHLFLLVPEKDKQLYSMPEVGFWGASVVNAFPDAHMDMKDAAQCLALGMSTASVFHSMQVVQIGLHKLADRLQVVFTKDIEVLNWGDILNGIDTKLKAMRNLPKSPQLDAEIQLGASASAHFFGIKEAWRNYVMHGRSTYDEDQARTIIGNVRAIMIALA